MRHETIPSGNVEILAMGRCDQGHDFFELRVTTGGRRRRRMLSMEEFEAAPDRVIALLEAGLVTPGGRADFKQRVERAVKTMRPTLRVVTRPGWYGRSFVFPSGEVFGDVPNLRVCLPSIYHEYGEKFASLGSLRAWRRIPQLAIGNTRLMTAIALGFAGPVASLLKVEPPAIQLVGPRGAGKSATVAAGGSVWGGRDDEHGTFVEGWGQTKNNVDKLAAVHSGALLVLDDTRTFERGTRIGFANFEEAVMRMGEGRLKGRLDDSGVSIRSRTPVLSGSNDSLDEMAGAVGVEIDDALRGRLIDVPLVEGVMGAFENLHGYRDHADFATELLRLAREYYGVASVEFIERIIQQIERDEATLIAWLRARREEYLSVARRRVASASRDLARFHQRFATIYAAGALAIAFRILPWTRAALGHALITCELAHVNLVAGKIASPVAQAPAEDPLVRLKAHVRHRRASFVDLRDGLIDPNSDHDHDACDGYLNRGGDGTLELLFSESMLREVCGGKAQALRVKAQLGAAGWLVRDTARPCTRRTIWAAGQHKREHVIAIRAEAFNGAVDAT